MTCTSSHAIVGELSCANLLNGEGGHCGHAVQFYERDETLAESVASFLRAGFEDNQVGVVIATEAHREAIDAELRRNGVNVAGLREKGRLICLDATETLALFMVDQMPDHERFKLVIGKLIAVNRRAGNGLRAFGEMVALLWAANNRPAALKLEEFWNELGKEHEFSLLCGYPVTGFASPDDAASFRKVCDGHSHVIPPESVRLPNLPNDADRTIALLQQKAAALEHEIEQRKSVERQLRDFLENATEGIHRVGSNGKIIWANRAELEMLGYTGDEYIGHSIEEFHADAPVIADILDRLKRGEQLKNYQARLKHKDGSIRYVEINSSVTWEVGRFAYTKCFTRDITDRANAQTTHQLLSAIVQSSDDAIISKDLDGIITSWNRGAERVFGYSPEEVIGKPITILIPPERIDEEPGILKRIRKGERIDHYETIRQRKDGTRLCVSLTVSPVRNADGQVIGASKVARDITERVRAKEQLEQLVQERTAALRDIVAELESFSYSIAHDMRAPLRTMHGYSRMLQEDYAQILPEEGRDFLQRIAAGAARLDALITDVLQYSRISRGEMPLAPVDVETLANEVVESYPNLRLSGAQISVTGPIPMVIANPAALTQCLSNLLSNAIKFNRPDALPEIRVGAEDRGEFVRVYVEDNGIGISEEGQKKIFHMFQQLNPANTFEGTGIGLTIVRKAVERMGGRVGVESKVGVGSRFWLELKRANGMTPDLDQSDSKASRIERGTILAALK